MPTITVLDDDYVTLWYHPEKGIVHHRIHKYPVPGVFRALLSAGAELLETHHGAKYLSDDRSNIVVDPEDIKWAEANWYPRVVKAGLKRWAMVMPSTMVGTLQSRTIVDVRRTQGIEVEGFESVEAAMAWLEKG